MKPYFKHFFIPAILLIYFSISCNRNEKQSLEVKPTVTTTDPSEITCVTAKSGGTITITGKTPVAQRGVCWSTLTGPHIKLSTITNDGFGSGSFTSNISALLAQTTYYVRAYVICNTDTIYGNEHSFTTPEPDPPSVTTSPVSPVFATIATCGGNITSSNGVTITSRGVCWSTSPGPNVLLPTKTVDGAVSGTFTSRLIGLTQNTTYYVRAYAKNDAGTYYGNELSFTTPVPPVNPEGMYPYGSKFPLFLYAINRDWSQQSAFGWNTGHTYSPKPPPLSFISSCSTAGMLNLGTLSCNGNLDVHKTAKTEQEIAGEITSLDATGNIAFWDIPEELRYWYSDEMNVLTSYGGWTRKYDSKQLPNFMYIPGHYSQAAVQNYVRYLDILPASCYPNYMGKPNVYVKWSIERTKAAVIAEGKTLGKDYKNGQKTVMAILECFETGMTPEESWHDFWLSVACDVKGIGVYAYAYSLNDATRRAGYAKLEEAVSKFTGTEQLNRVMIEGTTNSNINFNITSGPSTLTLTPPTGADVTYPSLTVLAKNWNGSTYIVAVNSNTSPVTSTISGITGSTVTVLFENRTLPVSAGSISDDFSALGVHIYKY